VFMVAMHGRVESASEAPPTQAYRQHRGRCLSGVTDPSVASAFIVRHKKIKPEKNHDLIGIKSRDTSV
jgi:hypothetical protein